MFMNTKSKNCIRVAVMVAVLAWPAVETYRLWTTNQKLKESQVLQASVQAKLDSARSKHVQVAGPPDAPAAPSDAKR